MDFLYCLVCLREILLDKKIKTWPKFRVVTAPGLKFRVVSRPPCPRLAARLGLPTSMRPARISQLSEHISRSVATSGFHTWFVLVTKAIPTDNMYLILARAPCCVGIADGVVVHGRGNAEHDRNLLRLMYVA